jgi:hypothetical protein
VFLALQPIPLTPFPWQGKGDISKRGVEPLSKISAPKRRENIRESKRGFTTIKYSKARIFSGTSQIELHRRRYMYGESKRGEASLI